MESNKTLKVSYIVYNHSNIPVWTLDEGAVEVTTMEEADQVAYDIIDEINATHRNRGYRYLMSVVLKEETPNRYLSGNKSTLVKVYVDCI